MVGPDIESWFQKDQFDGKPGIVAQWAELAHATVAQNWVKSNKTARKGQRLRRGLADNARQGGQAVDEGQPRHRAGTRSPRTSLAVPFFVSYSKSTRARSPASSSTRRRTGRRRRRVEPVKEGSDIQAAFFDMWLAAHPDVDLEPVPADMVMASGSGLDPHITLANARWQLDNRVAGAWAKKTGRHEDELHREIEQLLGEQSHAPLAGLVGVPLVNVLETNLALKAKYEKAEAAGK